MSMPDSDFHQVTGKGARACDRCGLKVDPGTLRKTTEDGARLCPACAKGRPGGGGVIASSAAEVEQVPLAQLRPYLDPEVPLEALRRLSRDRLDALKAEILAEGYHEPLKLSIDPDGNGKLEDGHHRFAVAEELGHTQVPVEVYRRSSRGENTVPLPSGKQALTDRFAETFHPSQVGLETTAAQKTAHDPGDPAQIAHCCFCFSGSTRYLTREGVKTFDETVGTVQWVLTAPENDRTGGRWVEAYIDEFGEQPLMRVTVQRNQRTKVIEATPDHRWLVKANRKVRPDSARIDRKGQPRDWKPTYCARGHEFTEVTTRIRKGGRECRLCAAAARPPTGVARGTDREVLTRDLAPGMRLSSLRPPGVGSLVPSDDGIRHGIVFGDGSATGASAYVNLWGEKDKQLLRYFPGCRYKPISTAGRVLGTGIPGVNVRGGLRAWMKAVPESESPAYLYGWLAGYFAADGTVSKTGQVMLASANLAHLEAARDVALGLGISAYGITMQMRAGFPGRDPSPLYNLQFLGSSLNEDFFLIEQHRNRWSFRNQTYERFGWTVVSVEPTGRHEKVYCATVPETHSFALEGNIWVGNCGSGKVIGAPTGEVECQACGAVFTVQVQPLYPALPQVEPEPPTEEVTEREEEATDADGNTTKTKVKERKRSGPAEDGDRKTSAKQDNWYMTDYGVALPEDLYLRHLAFHHGDDRESVAQQAWAEGDPGAG